MHQQCAVLAHAMRCAQTAVRQLHGAACKGVMARKTGLKRYKTKALESLDRLNQWRYHFEQRGCRIKLGEDVLQKAWGDRRQPARGHLLRLPGCRANVDADADDGITEAFPTGSFHQDAGEL